MVKGVDKANKDGIYSTKGILRLFLLDCSQAYLLKWNLFQM